MTDHKPNIPNDAYQMATIAGWLVSIANAHAEALNEAIEVAFATAKDLGYDMADFYDWDPETYLPKRGTGLAQRAGHDPDEE